ncbi:MAG: NYN domain-containing protein [Hyphomicrobiales bacterium]|nr:NYN domain-containing protein [Hyphomicrobiales bacterium]
MELERKAEEFRQIALTQNFSVRLALTRRGPKRQQKGVDVLLAIECLMHAVRNNIDEATIITSDLDFFPLFEALLQTKTKSFLRYQIGKASSELVEAADYAVPVTFCDFFECLPSSCRPMASGSSVNEETAITGIRQIRWNETPFGRGA